MSYYRSRGGLDLTPAVKNLLIINVLVCLALNVVDKSHHILYRISLFPLDGVYEDAGVIFKFQPYQLITHMFTHVEFGHLLFNMLALFMFGTVLERLWGTKRFLVCYFVSGLGAAAAHLLVNYLHVSETQSIAMGASGAIMGIVVSFAYLFPNTPLLIFPFPIAIKAVYVVLAYVAFDLFGGLSQRGDNIAHFAHLGGAATGFILMIIWNKTNKRKFY